jgi:hypothetical protein
VEACRQRWGLLKVSPHREEREREESREGMCVCRAFFPFRVHPRTLSLSHPALPPALPPSPLPRTEPSTLPLPPKPAPTVDGTEKTT